ncbi:MAG: HEAT repeat domain-containing protein [Candidatus Hodarchaeota archaeon]
MSKELKSLLKKAQSNNATDRYSAVVDIADLAEREAIEPLIGMIHDPDDDVKLVVATTLGFLGERFKDSTPVPALIDMLKNSGDNAYLKQYIIEGLGKIGDPEVGRLLADLIEVEESNPDILKEIITAIGLTKYKPAGKRIVKYLDHDEETVKLATAQALGDVGDSSCLDALFEAANGVSSDVAGNAIISIGKIGDRSSLDQLFLMLDAEPPLTKILERAVRDAIDMIK